ncbi:MAG: 4-hydroxylaminobenzoate lyase [Planctomycetota bacterium]|jgi:hypothetical protein
MSADKLLRLAELVDPVIQVLQDFSLEDPAAVQAELERQFPMAGETVQGIRTMMVEGQEQGWLLTNAAGGIQFGRIAKDRAGFSVDAVLCSGPGPRHRHPNGEVDLLFATDGNPEFDGHAEGWAVYGPGSEHVPAVAGGEMLILYLLPEGAIEWVQ